MHKGHIVKSQPILIMVLLLCMSSFIVGKVKGVHKDLKTEISEGVLNDFRTLWLTILKQLWWKCWLYYGVKKREIGESLVEAAF